MPGCLLAYRWLSVCPPPPPSHPITFLGHGFCVLPSITTKSFYPHMWSLLETILVRSWMGLSKTLTSTKHLTKKLILKKRDQISNLYCFLCMLIRKEGKKKVWLSSHEFNYFDTKMFLMLKTHGHIDMKNVLK